MVELILRTRNLVVAAALTLVSTVVGDESTTAPLTFEEHIRPILRAYCFDCHGAVEKKEGGLDLRLVRFLAQGGESGPAIVPGKADDSYLIQRIRDAEMPPTEGKVPAKDLATLERWIAAGAKTKNPEPESIAPGIGISDEERAWWAFQPIKRPGVQTFPGEPRLRGPIDSLLRKAMPSGLSFSPDADPRTLLKRVSFDLIGLPPEPEEIEAFLGDESPDAFDRVIDRLLASPHYGERWARHWLDVAGYADSEGGTNQDAIRSWAYKYRDYVIRAFNSDKPFDRFIEEQLAGDELAGPITGDLSPDQIELLTATGFLRMAADGTGSGDDSPEARNQVVADTIKIVSTSLMGMTVACAQCHDHRYDPILQTDYYALRAVLEPALDCQNWKPPQARLVSLATAEDRRRSAEIEAEVQTIQIAKNQKQTQFLAEATDKELAKFEEPLREQLRAALGVPADKRTPEQQKLLDENPSVNISPGVLYQYNQAAADELKKFDEQMAQVRAKKPVEEFLQALVEPPGAAPETHLFHRGDYRQPLQVVAPAMLSVLAPIDGSLAIPAKSDALPTTGRRLALARWLCGPQNPLTPRVLANRIWMHHFGRGLAGTPADFGKLGSPPTHPDVLDWLATELGFRQWSVKAIHREIVMSTAYRQSSLRTAALAELDAENRFYGRQNLTRLDAETLRDRVLATTGVLGRSMFGPPMRVIANDSGQVVIDGAGQRRALYTQQRRSQPVALLQAFDAPVMQTNCEARPSSTVATQSLMLMNGEFLLQQASVLADRVLREHAEGTSVDRPISPAALDDVWRLCFQRAPTNAERLAANDYLRETLAHLRTHPESVPEDQTPERQTLMHLAHALLCSNEFLYVD